MSSASTDQLSSDAPGQTLLLVDADLDHLEWAAKQLEAPGLRILKCSAADKALAVTRKTHVDLVMADLVLKPFDGNELLLRLRGENPNAAVILTSAFPTAGQTIEAMQRGALDLVRKESLPFEIRSLIENALRDLESRKAVNDTDEPAPEDARETIIGNSREMQEVFKLIGRVAQSQAPVLVTGESGCGKELVARAVHQYSDRRKHDLIALNCGAIPENLLESELFGHEKGSFTGASARRAGRFEQCDGGTLFLDEIGDMPLGIQVKLLRVLQDGTFSRVGSNETLKSDVRIVAATNKSLAEEVKAGRFREDLYYRLNVVEIRIPSLRERPGDIPLLAEFFLRKITRKHGMARIRLSGEALESLSNYRWPGNVRELENTMARACALATTDILLAEDIPLGSGLSLGGHAAFNTAADSLVRAANNRDGGLVRQLIQWSRSEGLEDEAIGERLGIDPSLVKKLSQ